MVRNREHQADLGAYYTPPKTVAHVSGVPQLERERVPMTRVARAGGIDQPAAAGAACGVATRT